jgi:hypothetical protein
MAKMFIAISDEAAAYVKQRVGGYGRGQGRYIESLIAADRAHREMRQLLEREREGLSSKQSWRDSGVNVD